MWVSKFEGGKVTVLREQTEERPLRRCEGEDESGKTERARVRRDIMASAEVAVVKQLDFTAEEGGPAEMVPVQLASAILASELAEAKENPSYESFQQAYAKIVELTDGRFERIRQCAANAAANGTGEGALRSMRDQFRSLKGSYVSLDTKEAFIDALMAGRPDGTESSLLTQAQSATSQSAEELRKNKKSKEECAEEIRAYLEALCEEHGEFESLKAELGKCLDRLNSSMKAYDDAFEDYTAHSAKTKLPKDALRQSISQAKASEAEKEQRKARRETEVQDAEAEVQALRERVEAARSELRAVESAETKSDVETAAEKRLGEHKEWLRQTIGTVGRVSGMKIAGVGESELRVSVTTEPDAKAFDEKKLDGCEMLEQELETISHEVRIGIGSAQTIESLEVSPDDVPFADLLESFRGSDHVPALVHAVNGRICGFKVREAYIKCLDADQLGLHVDTVGAGHDVSFKKSYDNGAAFELVMPAEWPHSGSRLTLRAEDKGLQEEFNTSGFAEGSVTAAVQRLDARLANL